MGETGREGSLVRIDDIKLWRAGVQKNEDNILEKVADAFLDALKRDGVHERVGVTEREAAMILLMAFNRLFKNMKLREIEKEDSLPEAIKHLCTFAVR